MMSAEARYRQDPVFHALVDTIYEAIKQKQYTATEVRDAAMLAAIMYEQTHLREIYYFKNRNPTDNSLPSFLRATGE